MHDTQWRSVDQKTGGGRHALGQYHFGRALFPSHPIHNRGRGCKSKFLQRSLHFPSCHLFPADIRLATGGGAKFLKRNAHLHALTFFFIRYTTHDRGEGPRNHSGGGKGRLEGEDTSPSGGHFFPPKSHFSHPKGSFSIRRHLFHNQNALFLFIKAGPSGPGPDSPLEGLLCPHGPPCLETGSTFSHPKASFFPS